MSRQVSQRHHAKRRHRRPPAPTPAAVGSQPTEVTPPQPTACDEDALRKRFKSILRGADDPEIPMELQRQIREQYKTAWTQEHEKLRPVIAQLMAEAEDDWLTKTGRPMPKDSDNGDRLDELLEQAHLAGWSPQEVVDGNFTENDVYRALCAAKLLRDERIADEIAVRTATTTSQSETSDRRPGRHKQEDDDLDTLVDTTWRDFCVAKERLGDRRLKKEWVETLPLDKLCKTRKTTRDKMKALCLRRLHNLQKKRNDHRRSLTTQARRTK